MNNIFGVCLDDYERAEIVKHSLDTVLVSGLLLDEHAYIIENIPSYTCPTSVDKLKILKVFGAAGSIYYSHKTNSSIPLLIPIFLAAEQLQSLRRKRFFQGFKTTVDDFVFFLQNSYLKVCELTKLYKKRHLTYIELEKMEVKSLSDIFCNEYKTANTQLEMIRDLCTNLCRLLDKLESGDGVNFEHIPRQFVTVESFSNVLRDLELLKNILIYLSSCALKEVIISMVVAPKFNFVLKELNSFSMSVKSIDLTIYQMEKPKKLNVIKTNKTSNVILNLLQNAILDEMNISMCIKKENIKNTTTLLKLIEKFKLINVEVKHQIEEFERIVLKCPTTSNLPLIVIPTVTRNSDDNYPTVRYDDPIEVNSEEYELSIHGSSGSLSAISECNDEMNEQPLGDLHLLKELKSELVRLGRMKQVEALTPERPQQVLKMITLANQENKDTSKGYLDPKFHMEEMPLAPPTTPLQNLMHFVPLPPLPPPPMSPLVDEMPVFASGQLPKEIAIIAKGMKREEEFFGDKDSDPE